MKFRYVRGRLSAAPRILDIGCGNHSPTLTKRWFPDCFYAGADIQQYNNSEADLAAMDAFYPVGADGSGYDAIPGNSFDLVLLHHVAEHMADPAPIVAALCTKLKPGGLIWIAFPSLRSLSLPHSCDETLNFCDDPTHIRVPDVREMANILLASGVSVLHAGRSREGFLTTLGDIVKLGKRLVRRFVTGRFSGRGLWYILGFEDHVLGLRR
ncbi:MAG TPA: methyltransferase domain-containing protein [Terracidiphilus sp.]|nr:methyltransferase domain-containing protein [Terracidiphilus sp.]